jgi:hypothetical protein
MRQNFNLSFAAQKVLNKFYLNFQAKNLVSRTLRPLLISQVGFEVIRSNFGALHCGKPELKAVNLKANIKRQNMATSSQGERKGNRLLKEKSPYLLQHAYNPVDW